MTSFKFDSFTWYTEVFTHNLQGALDVYLFPKRSDPSTLMGNMSGYLPNLPHTPTWALSSVPWFVSLNLYHSCIFIYTLLTFNKAKLLGPLFSRKAF